MKPCGFIEANKQLVCAQRVKPFVVGEEAKAVYRADRHSAVANIANANSDRVLCFHQNV